MNSISNFFESYIRRESIFKNKTPLQASFLPSEIPHRQDQIQEIANILAPCLKVEKPSNLFIYGKTGTGKTLTVRFISSQMLNTAKKNNIPLKIIYMNCKLKKIADTEYRLIAQFAREFGKEIPATGLPTDEIYNIFFGCIDKSKQIIIIILDELDQLVKKTGNEVLYNLTRINSELKRSQITIVGISNDLVFADGLDPRVKSSLSEEEIVFPPYNALQIQDILKERVKLAFNQNTFSEGVISKCAAYAAREHGDARRALELLRVAGEIAEREADKTIGIKHIDLAEKKIERDRISELVAAQPKQQQVVLYSILLISKNNKKFIFTGDIYELYQNLCRRTGLRPLTQRRISDVIGELDMLGIINARVISKGRYGRTREISLAIPSTIESKIKEILEKSLEL